MSSFTPSPVFRLANRMVAPLISWGLPIGARRAPMALLTVRGRKTGLERTVPVALAPHDRGWLLVAIYGISDWSRNLETAGEAIIRKRGRATRVKAERLRVDEAAPLLRDLIGGAPAMIQRMTAKYFTAGPESPIADWEKDAVAHPVFVLSEVG